MKKTQSATESMEVEEPKELLLEKKTSLKKENDKKKWMKRIWSCRNYRRHLI